MMLVKYENSESYYIKIGELIFLTVEILRSAASRIEEQLNFQISVLVYPLDLSL